MHVTRASQARAELAGGWGSQPGTRLSWLLDARLGDSTHGAVGRMAIDAGGGQAAHRHPGAEEVTVVLGGHGTVFAAGRQLPLEPGNLLYAPPGAAHAVRAGGQGLDLLLVLSAPSAAAAGWEEGEESAAGASAEARLLSGLETDEIELDDPATGFVGMHARWLADDEICGTERVVVGSSRFAPNGGAHELHRHPDAAEFFIALAGEGAQLDEDGSEVAVVVGDAALLPHGSWHGFRNTGETEVRAVFGFLGATSLDAAGYELAEASPA
jgi:quercetin dioxygenase-like cupin family protein